MSRMHEARRAALKKEEAALLPALPRTRAGSAALKNALKAAERMGEVRLSNEVGTAQMGAFSQQPLQREPARNRAALHHALRR